MEDSGATADGHYFRRTPMLFRSAVLLFELSLASKGKETAEGGGEGQQIRKKCKSSARGFL